MNMDTITKLKMITYNCKHNFVTTGDKYKFMDDLFLGCDFLLLQEHWLYKSECPKLLSLGSSTDMTAVSAMDESIHRVGRPFGGCAIDLFHVPWYCFLNNALCLYTVLFSVSLKCDVISILSGLYFTTKTNAY